MDDRLSYAACDLLIQMMEGKEVPLQTYVKGKIYFGESCGCQRTEDKHSGKHRQQLIMGKIEAGNQISHMMNYNDSLEGIKSLDELGLNIKNMLQGINCSEFIFCLNKRVIKYITSEAEYVISEDEQKFDKNMIILT